MWPKRQPFARASRRRMRRRRHSAQRRQRDAAARPLVERARHDGRQRRSRRTGRCERIRDAHRECTRCSSWSASSTSARRIAPTSARRVGREHGGDVRRVVAVASSGEDGRDHREDPTRRGGRVVTRVAEADCGGDHSETVDPVESGSVTGDRLGATTHGSIVRTRPRHRLVGEVTGPQQLGDCSNLSVGRAGDVVTTVLRSGPVAQVMRETIC